ncbi:MAG: hypothetical protein AAF236_15810, partial [Verrucomicrobiota bacterium]
LPIRLSIPKVSVIVHPKTQKQVKGMLATYSIAHCDSVDASNQVVDFTGSQSIEVISPRARESRETEAATLIRTKTTNMTFDVGFLGNVTTGTSTDRTKERFGGIWVRVYGKDGELLGEAKDLHDELDRLDFRFTGSTGQGFADLPLIESFDKLRSLFEALPKPPAGLPKGPPFQR